MEKFIQFSDGSTAFITGCKDDSGCEHVWDGDGLISFGNSEITMTEKQYHELYEKSSEEEWNEFHKDKGSVTGECTCSKCGVAYTSINNPHYL